MEQPDSRIRAKISGADLSQREVDYLVAEERARNSDDIVWPRTKLGLKLGAERGGNWTYI